MKRRVEYLVRRFLAPREDPVGSLPALREYSSAATEQDIFYCFRLLLGRFPHLEEWSGHSARAGQDLATIVRSYLGSREFAERGLLDTAMSGEIERLELPGFCLFVSRDDYAVGRHLIDTGRYDPGVAAVLRRRLAPGMQAIDIGANIGYFAMLMASLVGPAGRVTAVEPHPDNIRLLTASRRANDFDHIDIVAAAAGRGTGLLALNSSYSNGMTGDLPATPEAILAVKPILSLALDMVVSGDSAIELIKIDVEGAELNALIGLETTIARCRPVIVSEFSPTTLPGISRCTGPEYLEYLLARGYDIGVIGKDGSEQPFGNDVEGVMQAFQHSGVDHIDLIVTPA